jgi:hypothetical protein
MIQQEKTALPFGSADRGLMRREGEATPLIQEPRRLRELAFAKFSSKHSRHADQTGAHQQEAAWLGHGTVADKLLRAHARHCMVGSVEEQSVEG